jgi:hypothetical protein
VRGSPWVSTQGSSPKPRASEPSLLRTWNGVMDDGILLRGTWQGKLPQPLSGQICVLAFANPASNGACLGSDVMNAVASKQASSRLRSQESNPCLIVSLPWIILLFILALLSPLTCQALGRALTSASKALHCCNVRIEPMSSDITRDGVDAASEWVASAASSVISRAVCMNVGRSRRILVARPDSSRFFWPAAASSWLV